MMKRSIHREPVAACIDAAREASETVRLARIERAAPGMLAALRAALTALERPGGPQMGAAGKDRGVLSAVRAAIASAEGREP